MSIHLEEESNAESVSSVPPLGQGQAFQEAQVDEPLFQLLDEPEVDGGVEAVRDVVLGTLALLEWTEDATPADKRDLRTMLEDMDRVMVEHLRRAETVRRNRDQ